MTTQQSQIILKSCFHLVKKSIVLLFIQLIKEMIKYFEQFSLNDERFLKFIQIIAAMCIFNRRKYFQYLKLVI